MLESEAGRDKALLDLCLDVIYHPNMKAIGLKRLVALANEHRAQTDDNGPAEDQAAEH